MVVEAGHVAPRAEKRKMGHKKTCPIGAGKLEGIKNLPDGGHKKTCPIGAGKLRAALEPGYGMQRSFISIC